MKRRRAVDSHFCNPDFFLLPRAELFIRMSAGLQNKPETHILLSASFESFPFWVSESWISDAKIFSSFLRQKKNYLFFFSPSCEGQLGKPQSNFLYGFLQYLHINEMLAIISPLFSLFVDLIFELNFSLKPKYSFQLNGFINNGSKSRQKQVAETQIGSYCTVNWGGHTLILLLSNSIAKQNVFIK